MMSEMTAVLLNGKEIARQIRQEIKEEVAQLARENKTVTLAVLLIGDDPASITYIRNKRKCCEEVGIHFLLEKFSSEISQEELISRIQKLNHRVDVDGILVQLPLPSHISEFTVLESIDPLKDVDGLHSVNAGAMVTGQVGFIPGTPAGIIELLKRTGQEIDGKECVVVGRSNSVGRPLAQLLLNENGTVTVAHTHTRNLKEVCKRADILIAAAGRSRMITADYVKPGATVIDVGIHRDKNNKLSGDVDFESVSQVAGAITPVPGGVGPMTIAMLMSNCLKSRKRKE